MTPKGPETPLPTPAAPVDSRQKLVLVNSQCPGDGIMLGYAVQSLQQAYPDRYCIQVETGYNELYEGLYEAGVLTEFDRKDPSALRINLGYPTINHSNQRLYFYLDGMRQALSLRLNIPIPPAEHSGFMPMREEEKGWFSYVREQRGADLPYWVVNAGWKNDYTAKRWPTAYYQDVVEMFPDTVFVQVGHEGADHHHPRLRGPNVLDLVGKTDLRQLFRLVWSAFGVISPCSLLMLLGYAIPAHPRFGRRANIAIGGGREPNHWHQAPNGQYLHTCGMLDCCKAGGCWKSRVEPLGDKNEKDKSLCLHPVKVGDLQVGKCMQMIKPAEVGAKIKAYIDNATG